jgi:hypothetical protein
MVRAIGMIIVTMYGRWQAQYMHRLKRYQQRLKILFSENNTNTMTAADELMTKYIAKFAEKSSERQT